MKLNAQARKAMPLSEFGMPQDRGFPMNDATHDRLAISGASHAHNAGNLSLSDMARIQKKARARLAKTSGRPVPSGQ